MEAVVFDLDDTLAVPERDRATLLAAAVEAAGAPPLSREDYLAAHRRTLDDAGATDTREPIFEAMLAERDADADPAELARAYRQGLADALRPVEGAADLVADLRADYRVGLLTNGPATAGRDKLRTLGWEDAFDATVVTGEVGPGKPDERAFEAVLEALGVAVERTVHVGDQVHADVHGARDAGLRAVQVLYPGGPEPSPRADAHVERSALAAELPGVVASLCEE